jgi:hypothetical protein
MLRRWVGTAVLLGWAAAVVGCGGSKIENKPNFNKVDVPPAPTSEGGGKAANPTKIAN